MNDVCCKLKVRAKKQKLPIDASNCWNLSHNLGDCRDVSDAPGIFWGMFFTHKGLGALLLTAKNWLWEKCKLDPMMDTIPWPTVGTHTNKYRQHTNSIPTIQWLGSYSNDTWLGSYSNDTMVGKLFQRHNGCGWVVVPTIQWLGSYCNGTMIG